MHTSTTSQGGNMMGPCSCGLFHHNSSAFSMLFEDSVAASAPSFPDPFASSSVDCTLSLGTPSTRLTDGDHRGNSDSYLPAFGWGGATNHHHALPRTARSSGTVSAPYNNDPLFARRCANCDTTSTPLWRNGPRGPKSLCNACGIRFKKEERRAAASSLNSGEQRRVGSLNSNTVTNSFRLSDNNGGAEYDLTDHANNAISFLPWQLNVTLNDFTTY